MSRASKWVSNKECVSKRKNEVLAIRFIKCDISLRKLCTMLSKYVNKYGESLCKRRNMHTPNNNWARLKMCVKNGQRHWNTQLTFDRSLVDTLSLPIHSEPVQQCIYGALSAKHGFSVDVLLFSCHLYFRNQQPTREPFSSLCEHCVYWSFHEMRFIRAR